jgi:hypothetical protein
MITFPVVNINGTGKHGLVGQYADAADAVQIAMEAVRKAMPHGRDYQHDPLTYEAARREHTERLLKLQQVYAELDTLAFQIAQQGD